MTCYCDGTAHPWRGDYCGRYPAHDPTTRIEIERARRRAESARAATATPTQPATDEETDHG